MTGKDDRDWNQITGSECLPSSVSRGHGRAGTSNRPVWKTYDIGMKGHSPILGEVLELSSQGRKGLACHHKEIVGPCPVMATGMAPPPLGALFIALSAADRDASGIGTPSSCLLDDAYIVVKQTFGRSGAPQGIPLAISAVASGAVAFAASNRRREVRRRYSDVQSGAKSGAAVPTATRPQRARIYRWRDALCRAKGVRITVDVD